VADSWTPGILNGEVAVTLPACFDLREGRCVSKKELPLVEVCTPTRRTGPAPGADEAARLAARFKAVADPTRLRLLSLIAAHASGGVRVRPDRRVTA
jgi:hypothetical protein